MNQPDFVGDVPTEIWAEIFKHARKRLILEAPYDQTKPRGCDIPFSVSQVCGRFRQVAINTPRLWTSIAINFASPTPSSNLSRTNLLLERSKNSPLSIFLYEMKGLDIANHPEKRECFTALLLNIGRWKEASIEWANIDSDFWSSTADINPAPLLESLFLKPDVDEDKIRTKFLPSALWANSPRLRKLSVVLYVVIEDEDDFYPPQNGFSSWTMSNSIPYHQITHLRLDAHAHEVVYCSEILNIFQHASNLVCCFIEGISDLFDSLTENDLEDYPTPILLSQLRHLYLEPAHDGVTINDLSVTRLLNLITAPSLLSLSLIEDNYFDSESDAFESFIKRSSCALEELNLFNIDLGLGTVHQCMELASPSLRRLHVNDLKLTGKYHDTLLTSMSEWDAAANAFALCPHLEQLSLSPRFYSRENYMDPEGVTFIAKVLESRLRPPSGGSKIFKTLRLPLQRIGQVPPKFSALYEDPLGLTIGNTEFTINDLNSRIRLWKRLAYD